MFIKRHCPNNQSSQRAFAVTPKDNLIEFTKSIVDDWDEEEDYAYCKTPVIIATEFEDLEGWRWIIEEKVKESYLREYIDDFPLCEMDLKEDIFASKETIEEFFNQYFELVETHGIHILETKAWRQIKEKTEPEGRLNS